MKFINLIVMILQIFNSNVIICDDQIIFVTPDNCSESEFYDTIRLKCQSCVIQDNEDHDENSDDSHQSQLQIRSSDGFSCVCSVGSHKDVNKSSSGKLQCVECPAGKVRSLDGNSCVECALNAQYVNETQTCSKCDYDSIHSERTIGTKREIYCQLCPKGMVSNNDGTSCVTCHDSFVRISGNCSCPNRDYGGICIPKNSNFLIKEYQSLYQIVYDNHAISRVTSQLFVNHLQAAYFNCKVNHNQTACQLMANLCVLLHYSFYDDKSYDNNACMEYRLLLNTQFRVLMMIPSLYYGSDASNVLERSAVPNTFGINQTLEFMAARYSVDGRLLELSDLKESELQLCKEMGKRGKSAFIFGTTFAQSCITSAKHLWNSNDANVFYEIFLKNNINSELTLYPIPILIKNLKKNNLFINTFEDMSKWQLTHRFYLIDTISGIESKFRGFKGPSQDSGELRAKVLRYARSIDIKVELRKQDGSGSIYPPLITIAYEELESKHNDDDDVEINFSVTYLMNQWKAKQDIDIAIGVLCGCAVLWSIFRTWCWSKRSGKQAIDLMTVGKFILITCGLISNIFFAVNICAAINWLFTFKNQSVIHLMLPSYDQERSLVIYIIIAFPLKMMQLIHELCVNGTIDIFFIDWERPKKRDSFGSNSLQRPKTAIINSVNKETNESLNKSTIGIQSTTGSKQSIGSMVPIVGKGPNEKVSAEFPNVTIWRSYFVANEWIELCGCRRLSLGFHIMFVILSLDSLCRLRYNFTNLIIRFVHQWFGISNLASSDTRNSLKIDDLQKNVPISVTCRMAIGTLVYVGLALINILLMKFVYESLIRKKLNEFVDLCSVSNVSVFCMVSHRFGYYIHGRSANGRADVNMKEMHELLKREEDDLCSKRGLLPNSDQQTFQMSLPQAIYEHYQKLRTILTGHSQTNDRMHGFGANLSKIDAEKVISAYLSINKFLSGFIEHSFKDVDYTVRDKSNLELIIDTEFYEVRDNGFFYNDNGHSFESVLYYGLEITLLTFELMLFIIIDLCVQSFTFAGVFTYLISEMIRNIYINISRKNLVRKALIDERFLI